MFLTRLTCTNFRSYEAVDLELGPGVAVLAGPNGYGKTNLVEAVYYLATLGSHRVGTDTPLIRAGCESATVAARVRAGVDDDRTLTVAIEIRSGAANRAQLNQAGVRPREIVGAIRCVSFAPEDLAIVRGDPAERRRFLDELVIARWPRLAGVRSEFERALKQKTALLKALSGRSVRAAGAGAEAALGAWDEALVTYGAELVVARLRTVTDVAPHVVEDYGAIAPVGTPAGVRYESSYLPAELTGGPDGGAGPGQFLDTDPAGPAGGGDEGTVLPGVAPAVDDVRAAMMAALERRREDEIARGVCLVGPHRDDLGLSLGELPVKGYASHGEGWSYALALRLASLDVLHDDGVDPVLILDDVFAELDEQRRARVVAAMASVEQALVTVAVPRDLPDNLQAQMFEVGRGYVTAVGT
ncbi:MAG: DNA replication/repair protein RecF [Propionibacteriaceae bacterium]|nr:DNA replication/repair protein RecF [Propionibacteriaceae bacterium]